MDKRIFSKPVVFISFASNDQAIMTASKNWLSKNYLGKYLKESTEDRKTVIELVNSIREKIMLMENAL